MRPALTRDSGDKEAQPVMLKQPRPSASAERRYVMLHVLALRPIGRKGNKGSPAGMTIRHQCAGRIIL